MVAVDPLRALKRSVENAMTWVRVANALNIVVVMLVLGVDSYYAGVKQMHDLADWKTMLTLAWFVVWPVPIACFAVFVMTLCVDNFRSLWMSLAAALVMLASVLLFAGLCIPALAGWFAYVGDSSGLVSFGEMMTAAYDRFGVKFNFLGGIFTSVMQVMAIVALCYVIYCQRTIRAIEKAPRATEPGIQPPAQVAEPLTQRQLQLTASIDDEP